MLLSFCLAKLISMKWKTQEAKARFEAMLERTLKEGPQTVTRHGKPVAVLVEAEQYRHLSAGRKSFKALLASAPLEGVEIRRSRGRAAVILRASRKVRKESMRVNAEFAAADQDPGASARRGLARAAASIRRKSEP